MNKQKAIRKSMKLAHRSKIAMLGSNGDDGFPHIKALIKAKNDGLEKIWFSTNTSSRRVQQLANNNKACACILSTG